MGFVKSLIYVYHWNKLQMWNLSKIQARIVYVVLVGMLGLI